MTRFTKTRRSATKGRKKSHGRSGHGAPRDIPDDDIPDFSALLKEEESGEKKGALDPKGSDAFSRYMSDIGPISDPLSPADEFAVSTRIQADLAGALAALKKALPDAEKLMAKPPARRSPQADRKLQDAISTYFAFNPEGLVGEQLDAHLEAAAKTTLGLHMIQWHDRDGYRNVERFIRANLRLVIEMARRFAFHGYLSIADLVQEGNIGLLMAVMRFDPSRGFRFSTYGTWWIRHALGRAMADKGRLIRLPVHMIDFSMQALRARRAFLETEHRLPSEEELAKLMGCKVEKLRLLREGTNIPHSLDEPVDTSDGKYTLGDTIAVGEPDDPPWATLIPEKRSDMLRAAMEKLTPLERDIILLRFGLADDEELTLREIGEKYHLSRERIRQVQERGLEKLRTRLTLPLAAAV